MAAWRDETKDGGAGAALGQSKGVCESNGRGKHAWEGGSGRVWVRV